MPQKPSAPSVTQTLTALERIAPVLLALKAFGPRCVRGAVTILPSAPELLPAAAAPATGAFVPASLTVRVADAPGATVAGPVSPSSCSEPSP